MSSIAKIYGDGVKRRVLSRLEARDGMDRIFPAPNEAPLPHVDLVIVAAVENLELKKALFQRLDDLAGDETILATNDKDLFQLVSDSVKIYSTNKSDLKNRKDPHALLGVQEVTEKWGVSPRCIGEVLALTGDNVDNIPGIDGIGQA